MCYRYVLDIGLPSVELREKLWKQLIPKKAPTSDDIDHHVLAERYACYSVTDSERVHAFSMGTTLCEFTSLW